jgi:hypothetical protein
MSRIITTPRPPVSVSEAVRVSVDATPTEVYEVPTYRVPAEGPRPQRDVSAAAILTNVVIANTTAGATTVKIWIEDTAGDDFLVAESLAIAQDGYLKVDLDKQIMLSDEKMFFQMGTGGTAEVHVSLVLQTAEEFTVIVSP